MKAGAGTLIDDHASVSARPRSEPATPRLQSPVIRKVVMIVYNFAVYDSRTHKVAKAVAAEDIEVIVLARQGYKDELPPVERIDGYTIKRPRRCGRVRPLRRFAWFVWAFLHALRAKPDIVHCCRSAAMWIGLPCGLLLGRPVVYEARELFHWGVYGKSRAWVRAQFWAIEKWFYRWADVVIMTELARAEVAASRYRCRVPLIVHHYAESRAVKRGKLLHQRLGLTPETRIALYVGAFQTGRYLMEIIDLAHRLPPRCVVAFLGYGVLEAEMRQRIKEKGLESKVFLAGKVTYEEILPHVASADLTFCLIQRESQSYYLSVPQKFFESLTARTPLLSSDYPEMRFFTQRFNLGLCVDPDDGEAVVQGMVRLLTDEPFRAGIIESMDKAAGFLTWEAESRKILDAYRIIRKNRRGSDRERLLDQLSADTLGAPVVSDPDARRRGEHLWDYS